MTTFVIFKPSSVLTGKQYWASGGWSPKREEAYMYADKDTADMVAENIKDFLGLSNLPEVYEVLDVSP